MLLLICGIVYLALHLIPVFVADPRFWGIDSWAFLPEYAAFGMFAFGSLLLVPGIQAKIAAQWQKSAKVLTKVPVFIWIVLLGALFFLLGQKTFFLGDGYLRIRNLEQGLFLSPAEPLDTLVRYWLYALLKPALNAGPAESYGVISILGGMGLFTGLAYYLRRLFSGLEGAAALFAGAILSAGFIQLFFAYVESYSLVAAFVILFFVSSLAMAKESIYKFMPSVFFSLAVCFHPMALIFLPSYIYIHIKVISKSENRILKSLLTALLPLSLFMIVLLIFAINGVSPRDFIKLLASGERFLPLTNASGSYGLFSVNHLIDFINEILLTTPIIIALPLLFKNPGKLKGNPATPFLMLSAATGLTFAFTINPVLGYARDWDLFAVALLPVTLSISGFIILKHPEKLRQYAFPIVIAALLHTAPWIILNSNEAKSTARAERLAETNYWESHAKAALFDELKSYYFSKGDETKTTGFATMAYREKPSERNMLSLARQKINSGGEAEALNLLLELSHTNYRRSEVTFLLGTLFYNKKDFVNAEKFLKEAADIDKGNYEPLYLLGQIYMQTGSMGPAADHFKLAIMANPNRLESYTSLGGIYYDAGNTDDALAVFRKALSLAPRDAGTHYNLALCYAVAGDRQNALKHLKKAEEYGFDKKAAASLRNELIKN